MLDGFKILNPAWLASNVFTLYGGGGKGGGSAPKAPDYIALAKEQAKGNLDLAKYTTQANRINQITPYGTLTYTNTPSFDQTGYDLAMKNYQTQLDAYNKAASKSSRAPSPYSYNTMSGIGGIGSGLSTSKKLTMPTAPNAADYNTGDNWTATQSLSPEQQAILEANQKLSTGKLGYAQNLLEQAQQGKGGVDMTGLPSYGINPGESYSDAIMRRLRPTQEAQQEAFDAKMANQGVMPGTQAYDAAYRNFAQGQNDQLTSAIVGGMQTGLAANQQAYQQALQNMNQPVNMINALQGGSQVQSPNFVNAYNMQTPQSADLTGAAQNTYNAQMQAYNADQASNQGFFGGLMGLGQLGLGAYNAGLFGGGNGGMIWGLR